MTLSESPRRTGDVLAGAEIRSTVTGRRTRRAILGAGGALLAGLAGCGTPRARGPFGFDEGFESGLGGWERDVPPGADGGRVAVTDERSASGFRSARFDLEGAGRLWLRRRIDVDPGQAYEASLAATARGSAGDLVLSIGTDAPGLRESLAAEGWRTHAFTRSTPPAQASTLPVGVGIAVDRAAGTTAYVDDVKVTLVPGSESDSGK